MFHFYEMNVRAFQDSFSSIVRHRNQQYFSRIISEFGSFEQGIFPKYGYTDQGGGRVVCIHSWEKSPIQNVPHSEIIWPSDVVQFL